MTALGDLSWAGLASGAGGDEIIARCKEANSKFTIIDLRRQSLEKFSRA
ncbi:hypothetical protein [Bradyrhizobium sp. LB11.1]